METNWQILQKMKFTRQIVHKEHAKNRITETFSVPMDMSPRDYEAKLGFLSSVEKMSKAN